MFERVYRQRLETDLARWESDGVIAPAVRTAITGALPPLGARISAPVVLGIASGFLVAGAFLAFVAAHWIDLARLLRLGILIAGIIVAHGVGAWFAHSGRPVLADLCASVGAIIFGAGIALVGQMYHLGGDFAGGMLLWAGGALVAAALTGSRGAFAVALVAGCTWSSARVLDVDAVPHLPFVAFWCVAAGLALAWNSRVAAHLIAVAVIPWWITASTMFNQFPSVLVAGSALLFGGGLALAATCRNRTRDAGLVLAVYGAFSLAVAVTVMVSVSRGFVFSRLHLEGLPLWVTACAATGAILAFAAAAIRRDAGSLAAALAIGFALVAFGFPLHGIGGREAAHSWLIYSAGLSAALCLVVAGMLAVVRARMIAGWLGIAGVIAAITWWGAGSLLSRAAFLALSSLVVIVLAVVLARLLPGGDK